jgi:protein transport protein SEC13
MFSSIKDRRVIIWTNSDVSSSSTWTPKILQTFDDVVWHLSWSVSGNMLAVSGGDNKISLWKENLEGQWTCISDGSGNSASTAAATAAAAAHGTAPPAAPGQQQKMVQPISQ